MAMAACVAGMGFFLQSASAVIGVVAAVRLGGWAIGLNPKYESVMAAGRATVGISLLAAWFCGLFVATPLYTPYPRLVPHWLRAAGEPIVAPVEVVPVESATIDGKPVPTFLIIGPNAENDPRFQQQWKDLEGRWALVAAFAYQPSSVVWLDLHDPRKPEEQKR